MTTESTNETTTGGFIGDPAEAFNPPAAGGCCGSAPATNSTADGPAASTCCGTPEAAQSAGACCDPAAKTEAVASGAGCCG